MSARMRVMSVMVRSQESGARGQERGALMECDYMEADMARNRLIGRYFRLGFTPLVHHRLDVLLIDERRQNERLEPDDRLAVGRRAIAVGQRQQHAAAEQGLTMQVLE